MAQENEVADTEATFIEYDPDAERHMVSHGHPLATDQPEGIEWLSYDMYQDALYLVCEPDAMRGERISQEVFGWLYENGHRPLYNAGDHLYVEEA